MNNKRRENLKQNRVVVNIFDMLKQVRVLYVNHFKTNRELSIENRRMTRKIPQVKINNILLNQLIWL